MRIARFAKGDGVAYGVVEGELESGGAGRPPRPGLTIAELYGHPFGVERLDAPEIESQGEADQPANRVVHKFN